MTSADESTETTIDSNPPRALGEVLAETGVLEHLPTEVAPGDLPDLPDSSDATAVAQSQGGCGKCELNGKRPGTGRYCDCRFGRRKQVADMQAVEARFDNAGVPDRLRGADLQGLAELAGQDVMEQPAVQAVLDLLAGRLTTDPTHGTERPGLCLLGKNGIGKSGLLVTLAREVFRSGRIPLWIKYSDLVRDGVQAGYGVTHVEDIELSTVRLQAAQRVHTLCLDDLGDPFAPTGDYVETKDRRDILFRILSARHEQDLTTHITANFSNFDELRSQFAPRTADRIKEMCAVHTMEGPNLRERK